MGPGPSLVYPTDPGKKRRRPGPATFVYDGNGNQTSQKMGKTTITYGYDEADRLISVSGGSRPASGFTYDGDGNRVSQKVGGSTYTYLNHVAHGFTTARDHIRPDG